MLIYEHIRNRIGSRHKPVIFELGAHHGKDTKGILDCVCDPTYYAFEADPRHTDRYQRLGLPVEFHPVAIGAVDGEAEFHLSGPTSVGSSSLRRPKRHLIQHPSIRFDEMVCVPVVTLDTFCRERGIRHVDFIWADVQGAEGDMVAGGREILRNTDFLYTEYADDEVYEGQATLAELMELLGPQWRILEQYTDNVLLIRGKDVGDP